ncbi:MAG: chemotaxis protein CheW [Bdellovibrionales bacterium]
MQLVTMYAVQDLYAMNVENTVGFFLLEKITQIPESRKNVLGVTDVRGEILPVICLRGITGNESA